MALRIRKDGRILCAAMHPAEEGDTYIHDGISYILTVEERVIVTEPMDSDGGRGGHRKHGEWWWAGNVPKNVQIERFEDDGCMCQGCGKRYKVDLSVPNELWEKIKPEGKAEGAGLLCGSCIMTRIEQFDSFGAYKMEKSMNDLTDRPNIEEFLIHENKALRKAGCELSEAAMYTIKEYDGLHRLALAVSVWAKAVADEGGRGEIRTELTYDHPAFVFSPAWLGKSKTDEE